MNTSQPPDSTMKRRIITKLPTLGRSVKSKVTQRVFDHPLDLFSILLIYSTVPLVVCLVLGGNRSRFLVAAFITYSLGAAFLSKWLHSSVSKEREHECATEPKEGKSLVSLVRHDLRNSLNVIMGFADLLSAEATGTLNEKQRLYVHNIRAGSQRMLILLNSKEDGTASKASSESLDQAAQI
jgi:signal transduction histidine kinase